MSRPPHALPSPGSAPLLALVCGGIFCAVLAVRGFAADSGPKPAAPDAPKIDFARVIAPLIKKYCFECHTGDEPEGELSLFFETEADFLKRVSSERGHFRKMTEVLLNYDMPPSDAMAQPTDAERDKLVTWVERNLLALDRNAPRNPGKAATATPPRLAVPAPTSSPTAKTERKKP